MVIGFAVRVFFASFTRIDLHGVRAFSFQAESHSFQRLSTQNEIDTSGFLRSSEEKEKRKGSGKHVYNRGIRVTIRVIRHK